MVSKVSTLTVIAALGLMMTASPAATASSWTINYYDSCTGSYCDPGEYACFEALCIDSSIIAMTIACDETCSLPGQVVCTQLPHTCEAVGILLQTPVGTCTYSYCDWNGVACVQVDTPHCLQPQAPAACVGTLCDNQGLVCAWTQATPQGNCTDLTIRCTYSPINTCYVAQAVALNPQTGACGGNPQSYDYSNPDCHGGIACVDMPNTKLTNFDFCFVIYTVM